MGLSSDEIARKRREKGWTQDQLGSMLGISGKAVSKWERGISNPRESHQAKLVELFGLSSEEEKRESKLLNSFWSIVLFCLLMAKRDIVRIISTAIIFSSVHCYLTGALSTQTVVVSIGLSAGLFCFCTLIKEK